MHNIPSLLIGVGVMAAAVLHPASASAAEETVGAHAQTTAPPTSINFDDRAWFDAADTNHDGVLSLGEVTEAPALLGAEGTEEEWFRHADTDGNGTIDLEEARGQKAWELAKSEQIEQLVTDHPGLAEKLAEYPAAAEVLAQHPHIAEWFAASPHLAERIAEHPQAAQWIYANPQAVRYLGEQPTLRDAMQTAHERWLNATPEERQAFLRKHSTAPSRTVSDQPKPPATEPRRSLTEEHPEAATQTPPRRQRVNVQAIDAQNQRARTREQLDQLIRERRQQETRPVTRPAGTTPSSSKQQ